MGRARRCGWAARARVDVIRLIGLTRFHEWRTIVSGYAQTESRRMTQTAKLYAWLLANRRGTLPFHDFERLLAAFGFQHARTIGSHRQYIHRSVPRPFPIQPSGKDAKRYQVDQFLDMVEEYDLSIDDELPTLSYQCILVGRGCLLDSRRAGSSPVLRAWRHAR
ncbi:type II toxin-antitoxin system HicA family toxin [Sphingomonas sp. Leaf38]|uniref:type II toxin-antitoxin system HicA family toxin n=1 Tax=Sphingomonas sp. Leaf38 TaxID=1736217 RepID=UPI002AA2AADD|nr:type II toxin-antitoxin system HicA family toxin [Sphingomonas sp. Leaf38]